MKSKLVKAAALVSVLLAITSCAHHHRDNDRHDDKERHYDHRGHDRDHRENGRDFRWGPRR
ncbi:hypothetical protein [Azomonas macrocytogenes]|uniref:ABC-type Zn2+ transport system substrate-binding protein/surface adhesin n=1 Tax=Azomonas macrocytogenes TaxID=69962 RepID=A0A839T422_AZOMA|nr:hypothetical protein [Azomonas macrocytogenes]MBB3104281.1 ABC-type Zn2+ transport system substrate-binding protein/surface adhesin [Azomonas macrocytogenes]